MKKDIHPSYEPVEFQFGEDVHVINSTYQSTSALKKNKYVVDVDFRTHPAWAAPEMVSKGSSKHPKIKAFEAKYGKK